MAFFPIHLSPNRQSSLKKIRKHLFTGGRVQGVFFRDGAKKMAQKLGVFGWVKNKKDGSLEMVLEGEKSGVEKMEKWAQKGPIFAKIESFKSSEEEYRGEFDSFEIRYDL